MVFLGMFLVAKGILVVFASANLSPPVILELGGWSLMPKFQRYVLSLAVVGANAYLHFRGGRRSVSLSLVPTVISLVGLAWATAATGGRLDGEGILRVSLFGVLTLAAMADQGQISLLREEETELEEAPAPEEEAGIEMIPEEPQMFPEEPTRGVHVEQPSGVAAEAAESTVRWDRLMRTLDSMIEPALGPESAAAPHVLSPEEGGRATPLAVATAPLACPACNTINPRGLEACAGCSSPLRVREELYFTCPVCAVGLAARTGRCAACDEVFLLSRIEDPLEFSSHFTLLQGIDQSEDLHFVHLSSEDGTITYLVETEQGYEVVTLLLRTEPPRGSPF